MKTGNVSRPGQPFAQTKPVRQDKTGDKREPDKSLVDKVDLSTTGLPLTSTPASYVDALNLSKGLDYRQVLSAQGLSKDAAARISELLQA